MNKYIFNNTEKKIEGSIRKIFNYIYTIGKQGFMRKNKGTGGTGIYNNKASRKKITVFDTPSCAKPSLIERIINIFPGPYVLKCLIFSSVFGVPALLLFRFFDTLNTQAALEVFGPPLWQNIATFTFANFVLLFYATCGVRYMRSRIAQMIPQIEPLMPKEGRTVQDIFHPVCAFIPAAILSILLAVVSLLSFPNQGQHAAGPISLVLLVISFPFMYLVYGTFIWTYLSSIKCLYDLSRQPLRLAEFYEDDHLGMKSLGSLSISLALVYFLGLGLIFFSFLSVPPPLEFAVVIMILAGVILFFLPLFTIHHKMLEKKRNEREKLKSHYTQLLKSIDEPLQTGGVAEVKHLRHMMAVEIIDRHITAIPEWPIDARSWTRLSAIVLTVIISIFTRIVLTFLGM